MQREEIDEENCDTRATANKAMDIALARPSSTEAVNDVVLTVPEAKLASLQSTSVGATGYGANHD